MLPESKHELRSPNNGPPSKLKEVSEISVASMGDLGSEETYPRPSGASGKMTGAQGVVQASAKLVSGRPQIWSSLQSPTIGSKECQLMVIGQQELPIWVWGTVKKETLQHK